MPMLRRRRDGIPAMIRRPRENRWRWFGKASSAAPPGATMAVSKNGVVWQDRLKDYPPLYPAWMFDGALYGFGDPAGSLFYYWRTANMNLTATWSGFIPAAAGRGSWRNGLYRLSPSVLVFICAKSKEVFRTTDGGENWNLAHTFARANLVIASPLKILPSGRIGLLGCVSSGNGYFYYSDDNGANWTEVEITLAGSTVLLTRFLVADLSGNLYAGFRAYSGTAERRYESTDGGATWSHLGTITGMPAWYYYSEGFVLPSGRVVICAPHSTDNPSTVPNVYLWWSDDNGENWTQVFTNEPGGPVRRFGNALYYISARSGKIRKSPDGNTWADWSPSSAGSGLHFGLAINGMTTQ